MNKNLFSRLVESVNQMNDIIEGGSAPSREFSVNSDFVKEVRKKTGLTQAEFCLLIDIKLGTLRNWEQGRREPTGPAKVLLRVIQKDPKRILMALTKR